MCGIIGVRNEDREAAPDLYFGLLSMQHRGKESAGIVAGSPRGGFRFEGGLGELPQAFWGNGSGGARAQGVADPRGDETSESVHSLLPLSLGALAGRIGIGHVRYGTAGGGTLDDVQPVRGVFRGKDFYVAHNGNLVNARELREAVGSPAECSDTRVIADLIAASSAQAFEDALLAVLSRLAGAFSLVLLFDGKIYAVKDPYGFHPLQVGLRGGDHIVASESCAFDLLEADLVRDLEPGEMLVLDERGCTSSIWAKRRCLKIDLFEYIYFLRPDSIVHGAEAGQARYFMGRALAEEHPVRADMVVPVSDSGNHAALGYYEGMRARGHDIEFRPWALFRPHTVSRTFIEPFQEKRQQYLRLKFNPRPSEIRGKRLAVVDDSIVRANTLKVVSRLLRSAGASEIHVVISSPMYLHPDIYGIDTYRTRKELIASRFQGSVSDIARELGGLAYLGHLSLEATQEAVLRAVRVPSGLGAHSFYTGPFTGEYPAGTGDLEVEPQVPPLRGKGLECSSK